MVTTRSRNSQENANGDGVGGPESKRPRYTEYSESEFEESDDESVDMPSADENAKQQVDLEDMAKETKEDEDPEEIGEDTEEGDEESAVPAALPSTPTTLSRHIEVAKPVILKQIQYEGVKLWDSLDDTEWQEDYDICVAAFSRDLDPAKLKGKKILADPKGLIMLFKARRTKVQVEKLWDYVPVGVRGKLEVGFGAYNAGLDIKKLPKAFTKKDTLKEGVRKGLFRWTLLPKEYQKDIKFASLALRSEMGSFLAIVRCLGLKDKVKLWTKWACEKPHTVPHHNWHHAPHKIKSDRALMLSTIVKAPFVMYFISDSLITDIDFLNSVLERNILALAYLPAGPLVRRRSIISMERVLKFIRDENCGTTEANLLKDQVPAPLWSDRNLVVKWVSAGYDLHSNIPAKFHGDEELLLTHAKHFSWDKEGRYSYSYPTGFITQELRSNKDFLLQLLRFAPARFVIDSFSYDLRQDAEVCLFACSQQWSRPHMNFYNAPVFNPYPYEIDWRHQWARQLREYERFFKGIVCGGVANSGSPLTILDLGPDANIKKNIASFLDFPKGEQLTWLFQVGINMGIEGFNPLRKED